MFGALHLTHCVGAGLDPGGGDGPEAEGADDEQDARGRQPQLRPLQPARIQPRIRRAVAEGQFQFVDKIKNIFM